MSERALSGHWLEKRGINADHSTFTICHVGFNCHYHRLWLHWEISLKRSPMSKTTFRFSGRGFSVLGSAVNVNNGDRAPSSLWYEVLMYGSSLCCCPQTLSSLMHMDSKRPKVVCFLSLESLQGSQFVHGYLSKGEMATICASRRLVPSLNMSCVCVNSTPILTAQPPRGLLPYDLSARCHCHIRALVRLNA